MIDLSNGKSFMQEPRFTLSTTGEIVAGIRPTQVQQNLRAHLKLPEMHIGAMFSGKRTVIKKNVDAITAQKYINQFYTMGLVLEKEPIGSPIEYAQNIQQIKEQSFGIPVTEENSEYPQVLAFEFKGKASEYFKIWIVGVALSILTLGIYSAWAKVRNKQYFYSNTFLDGSAFEYTADAIDILKWRVIVAVVLISYFLLSAFVIPVDSQFLFTGLVVTLLVLSFPWLLLKSLAFNANNIGYRNVSFHFKGNYLNTLRYFILIPLLSVTLIFIPYAWHRKHHYFVNNICYGKTRFTLTTEIKDYIALIGFAVVTLFTGFILFQKIPLPPFNVSAIFAGSMIYLIAVVILRAAFKTYSHNLFYNNILIQQHGLGGSYEFLSYSKLLLSNTLGVLLTLGLLIPWARVRSARYHAEHTQFIATEDFNSLFEKQQQGLTPQAKASGDNNTVLANSMGV